MAECRCLELAAGYEELNNLGAARHAHEPASLLIGRIALLALIPEVVAPAQEKYPSPVRTLDLHLASASFLLSEGVPIRMATYDQRMRTVVKRLKVPLYTVAVMPPCAASESAAPLPCSTQPSTVRPRK